MNSPETLILRELLAHDQAFVSGTALAAKAGMSRVAIWQHMEKLRLQGFEFEAVRSRGYRLTARPEGLNATLIRAFLPLRDRGLTISLLDHVDSTNDEAARELANGRAISLPSSSPIDSWGGRGRFGRAVGRATPTAISTPVSPSAPGSSPSECRPSPCGMGANLCDLIANFFRGHTGRNGLPASSLFLATGHLQLVTFKLQSRLPKFGNQFFITFTGRLKNKIAAGRFQNAQFKPINAAAVKHSQAVPAIPG